jgi:hypothetical protein
MGGIAPRHHHGIEKLHFQGRAGVAAVRKIGNGGTHAVADEIFSPGD